MDSTLTLMPILSVALFLVFYPPFLVLLASIVSHPLSSAKCARFYSKFWRPGCESVDAFNMFNASCSGVNNYLVPPVFLIALTLAHLETLSSRLPSGFGFSNRSLTPIGYISRFVPVAAYYF